MLKKNKNNKGFTLIEILITIAIIGILASIILVKLSNSRNRATIAAYKSTLTSLVPAVASCCSSTTNTLRTTVNGDICNPAIGSLLPTAAEIKASSVSYGVVAQCSAAGDPSLSVTPDGLPIEACNAVVNITANGIKTGSAPGFPGGC